MGTKHILWYYRMSLWTIDSIRKELLVKDLQNKYSRRMLGKHKFLQVSGSIGRTKKHSIKWERVTLYWSARSWHDWEGSITWRIVISSLISWKQMILQETWNFGRMHEIEYCRNLCLNQTASLIPQIVPTELHWSQVLHKHCRSLQRG